MAIQLRWGRRRKGDGGRGHDDGSDAGEGSNATTIEMVHRMVDRRLWWALVAVAVIAFGAQAFALTVLSTPRPVVAFDSTGRPLVFGDTHRAAQPNTHRVRAFVEDFLDHYVGVDGRGFDAKMVKALTMMTDAMRGEVVASEGYRQFKAKVRGQDVVSRFEDVTVEVGPMDPADTHGPVYAAVIARQVFTGADSDLDAQDSDLRVHDADLSVHSPAKSKPTVASGPWVFLHLRARRVPVTAQWPYGLLVEAAGFAHRETLDEAQLAKAEALGW